MSRPVSRETNIRTSFKDIVVGDYSSEHVKQIVRSAMQRSEKKSVPFCGLDQLLGHVLSYLKRKPVCDCCGKAFKRDANGRGGGGSDSLSIHRVIASLGYVTSNVRIICHGCNLAIGEIQTMGDVYARVRALRWQAKILLAEAKKLNWGD